jgi:predicted ester cyclase
VIEAKKAVAAPNPDARGDLQLMLANGDQLVSVALWKGTQTAPLPGPDGKEIPATGKKFGFLMAHTVELDAGRTAAKADADYVEIGTYLAQLGLSKAPARKVMEAGAAEPTVAIAKNDAEESGNVAAVKLLFEIINKHDAAGTAALLADNYRLHEVARPADANKKESLASTKELFKAFPDVKIEPSKVFAAGGYVVAIGSFEGTNDGDMPSMGLKKTGKKVTNRFLEIFRLEGGKVVEDWLFYNGAAFMAQLGAS